MGKIEGEREINSYKNIDKEEEIKEQEQMQTVLRKQEINMKRQAQKSTFFKTIYMNKFI